MRPAGRAASVGRRYRSTGRVGHYPINLLDVRWVAGPLPEPARLFQSVRCAECGEGVMEARARLRDGQPVCPQCYGPEYARRG